MGSITFLGQTDVRDLDIDGVVEIRHREVHNALVPSHLYLQVIVYPFEEGKPTLGAGLNKPSIVTLENVWPRLGTSEAEYSHKLEKCTAEMEAEFIGYRAGKWTFKVPHFSRFGLSSSSESESDSEEDNKVNMRRQVPPTRTAVGIFVCII